MSAYLYGGLALLVVGLGIATWGQSKRNEVLVAQNAGLRAELSTLSAANASQKQTIDELTTANVGLAAQAVTHAREYKAALQDLSSANVVRNALQKALMAKESTDRQSVACQALLGMDIKRVCPQIAEDMQSRAK